MQLASWPVKNHGYSPLHERSIAKRRHAMTDHKKKGDFKKNGKEDVGGNKKQENGQDSESRTGNQNSGHGGHK
jgi:hypothetical protein